MSSPNRSPIALARLSFSPPHLGQPLSEGAKPYQEKSTMFRTPALRSLLPALLVWSLLPALLVSSLSSLSKRPLALS
jgi:hypothetical protein